MGPTNRITGDGEHEHIILECMDPDLIERPASSETPPLNEISISTADISSWDLPFILSNHHIVKVNTNPTRLIEQSTYFQSLLSGNFSESSNCSISIYWSLEIFLHMLRFMHGCRLEITFSNFLPLCRAAVYFGLEKLVLECRTWFSDQMSTEGLSSNQLQLDYLVHVWNFGLEQAIDWIVGQCTSYVAKNFMWAMSCETFVDLPYSFLASCVKHPHLTVDSERHLCEALLAWLSTNIEPLEQKSINEEVWIDNPKQIKNDWFDILGEIHDGLLPLFHFGCCYYSALAKQGVTTTIDLLKRLSKGSNHMSDAMRIRLTEYSKKLDLSGCPQITSSVILHSVFRQSTMCPSLLEGIRSTSSNLEVTMWLSRFQTFSFEGMVEVDISKCSQLHIGVAMECFRKSFPFLRTVRMAYLLDLETKNFCKLFENSSVCEADLTVDVSPLLSSNVSILYSECVSRPTLKRYFDISSCRGTRPSLSNITKLILKGRTDFSDLELYNIAKCCVSLSYLNIEGCISVTDFGIAKLILRCRKLHSIIANDTSFGGGSVSALCSRALDTSYSSAMEKDNEHLKLSGINLEMLHIGGCKGVFQTSLVEILSLGHMLKSLCLRDTCLGDHALYKFNGSSLKMLDVSNTMISGDSLRHTVLNNPGLKYLEAKGCRNLCPHLTKNKEEDASSLYPRENFFSLLGKECNLVELAIGWGFSFFSLEAAGPALRSLKTIDVGLGGSLGQEGLTLLCALCPLLESVTILFQVISDGVIRNLLETLRNLQALSVCYCIGDVSPSSLKCTSPKLRKLKLDRVTPWMTNDELAMLTQNCANLVELSLVGCRHLDVDSQQIISSGWPGLTSLHLEDCGAVTTNGIGLLFDCKAMEVLLLRHNGPGIRRNFILDAAIKLPMLRSISLDWCDANEGDFDLPSVLTKQCENFEMQAPEVYIRLLEHGGSEEAGAQGDPSSCVE